MKKRQSFIVRLELREGTNAREVCARIRSVLLRSPFFGKVTVRREFVNQEKHLGDGTVIFPDGNKWKPPYKTRMGGRKGSRRS